MNSAKGLLHAWDTRRSGDQAVIGTTLLNDCGVVKSGRDLINALRSYIA